MSKSETNPPEEIKNNNADLDAQLTSGDEILTSGQSIDRYGFLGGSQYTDPDSVPKLQSSVIQKREMKWRQILETWDYWMSKRFKKVRDRCREGIPSALRARAWQHLSGAVYLQKQNQNVYQLYLKKEADPKHDSDIRKDLHRSFPSHEMFAQYQGQGQVALYRVLKAYTLHNPKDGFCQAHVPLASVLLMHMSEEEAFWTLVALLEKYLPDYYSHGMKGILNDGNLLMLLLRKVQPKLYNHMKDLGIEPALFMVEWFLCIFSRDLPWRTVLRVWDMFFCEGVKVLFKVALVLLIHSFDHVTKYPNEFYEFLSQLKTRNMDQRVLQEEFLVREVLALPISVKDMKRAHQQLHKKNSKQESQ